MTGTQTCHFDQTIKRMLHSRPWKSARFLLSVVPCMSCTGFVTSVHSVWQAVHLGYWLQSPQGFRLDSICRCAIVSHCIEIWTAGLMAEGPMGGSPHLKHLMDGFSKAVKIVVY